MAASQVLFFGDQVIEKLPAIRSLYLRSRSRPLLSTFLRRATEGTRSCLSQLTLRERKAFGHFTSLLDLAEHYAAQTHPSEIVGAVLITAAQIGDYLLFCEDGPPQDNSGPVKSYQFGVCVGLLAAALAAAERRPLTIVGKGVEIVEISFRLGLHLFRRSQLIQDTEESWGCTLITNNVRHVESCLLALNHTLPPSRQAYIGMTANAWITVFAPPSTLERLMALRELAQVPHLRLSTAIAVHAQHLLPIDYAKVVGDSPALEVALPENTCISCSRCEPFEASTLRELLYLAVKEISQHPISLDRSLSALALSLSSDREVVLNVFGPTLHTDMARQTLSASGVSVHVRDSASKQGYESDHNDLVAIVGMSGRFPHADTLEEFWEILRKGEVTHESIPLSRFPIDDYHALPGDAQTAISTRFGCFLRNPGHFDNRFFNISPREAMQMDPLQRMLLMVTHEALESAGYAGEATQSSHPSRIAAYFGQTTEDWRTINDQQGTDTHYLSGSNRAFAPGRLNHFFRWGGGYYSVDTACSSSSTAIHLACQALRTNDCDTAVVGGGSLFVLPELYSGLSKGGFLSATGGCKPFSDQADGYCRGEAVGAIVLRRLEDALRDHDNVLAVVRGTARNSNAGEGSITHPGDLAQKALFRKLLRDTNVDANEINFVEMHGTGTQAGDTVEMRTVSSVFAQQRPSDNPLHVGAVKANIGHSEAAAGVVSVIKAILMMQNDQMPPQPGYPFKVNRAFPPLAESNILISDGTLRWHDRSKTNAIGRILINGFDAAGGNTTILIEGAPGKDQAQVDPRTSHVVVCSARTATSLASNKERLRQHLSLNDQVRLADIAYTTTARRTHQMLREAYVVESVSDLLRQLSLEKHPEPVSSAAKPRLAFAFTGQSSQYTSMGSQLYSSSPTFRGLIDSYESICAHMGLASFMGIIVGTQDTNSASAAQNQLAIVALEIALATFLQSLGLRPSLVIGHSLGEYAALCVAGVLSVHDTLYLVHARAVLVEKHCNTGEYAMLAASIPVERMETLLGKNGFSSVEVACINGPSATVVSGAANKLEAVKALLNDMKVRSTILDVPYGFHCAQMEPVLLPFSEIVRSVHLNKPTINMVSTLTGAQISAGTIMDCSYLVQQMRQPVNFLGAVRTCEQQQLIQDGDLIFEVGPQPICIGLMKSTLQQVRPTCLATLRKGRDDWSSLSTCLAKAYEENLPVAWSEFHKDFLRCLNLLQLPSYAWDVKDYWVSYAPQQKRLLPSQPPVEADVFISPSLQRLESITRNEKQTSATFMSSTSHPDLSEAIGGHMVDGAAICPAAVFADMALTATKFLLEDARDNFHVVDVELTSLAMIKPLVLQMEDKSQKIRVAATLDRQSKSVSLRFNSVTVAASNEHATCEVLFGRGRSSCLAEWAKMQRLVKGRANALAEAATKGAAHRLMRPVLYKLFANLVKYSDPYQALDEVWVDDTFNDAAACMTVGDGASTSACSPYTLDALVHLAGFILNGNLSSNVDNIHIANHLGSLRILGDLTRGRRLTCYTMIREQNSKGATTCDVYVFDDIALVAMAIGIVFQKIPRSIFAVLTGDHQVKGSVQAPSKRPMTVSLPASGMNSSSSESAVDSSDDSGSSRTSIDTRDLAAEFLKTVSDCTGVSTSEMTDGMRFEDMGVDSPMTIAILADFRKRTGVELAAAFLADFPDVREVIGKLGSPLSDKHEAHGEPNLDQGTAKPRNKLPRMPFAQPAPGLQKAQKEASAYQLLRIVASQLGLDNSELVPSIDFASAGVDSVMSIRILADFKESCGIELPAAFFGNNPTVADAIKALPQEMPESDNAVKVPATSLARPFLKQQRPSRPPSQQSETSVKPTVAPAKLTSTAPKSHAPSPKRQMAKSATSPPAARAQLIQGKSRSEEAPLFLATDGSGTATGYIHLKPLPDGRRIYGLESPFIDNPAEYTCTVQDMADLFIKSIRQIQSHGPYLIGGWSAGAIYAYEIAYRLTIIGEKVDELILMDMRVPHSVPDAEEVTMAFVEKTGAFTGVNRAGSFLHGLSERQKMHLTSTVRALIRYDPLPFQECDRPRKTHLIWATKGLNESPNPEERDDRIKGPAAMGPAGGKAMASMTMEEFELELKSWFFAKRYEFGTNGWEDFVGSNITVHKVEADHFSMVAKPQVEHLGTIVQEAIKDVL